MVEQNLTRSPKMLHINPIVLNAPLLYPLKISETTKSSNVFRGKRKGELRKNVLG